MDINHRTHLKTEVVLPAEQAAEKLRLPGCSESDQGVSFKQLMYIRNFCLIDLQLDSSTTWGDARTKLREMFKLKDNRPDFTIATAIRRYRFGLVADNPINELQFDLLSMIIAVLCGSEKHFDLGVQARVDAMRPEHRTKLVSRALDADTNGEMSRVVQLWRTFTGQVNGRMPTAPTQSQLVGASTDPANAGEEPF